MEQNKVDMFIATMGENFPSEKLGLIREQLLKLDDNKLVVFQSIDYKKPTTVLLLAIFLGGWGIDRFMLGDSGLGVVKILTCGGAGIWALIDIFTASNRTKEYNYKKFSQLAY